MLIPAPLAPRVKAMQVIAAGLMMGLAIFLAIVGFVEAPAADPARAPVLTYLVVLLLVCGAAAAFVLPAVVTRQAVARLAGGTEAGDALLGKLLEVRTTALILGLAPVEGAGLFAGIAYLIERHPLALGASLAALVVMATRFPTFASVADWLQGQKDAVASARLRGR